MSDLKKGMLVMLDGQPRILVRKPQKAIDGTWMVVYGDVFSGEVSYGYYDDDYMNNVTRMSMP
jgi:hypothetical protein